MKAGNTKIRELLVQQKNTSICGVNFWKRKYGADIAPQFNSAFLATKESRLRVLHFKILHNIYPTNIILCRMKLRPSEQCDHCKSKDYIEHFFINCSKLSGFWVHVFNTILKFTNHHFERSETHILLGFGQSYKNLPRKIINAANHILLIAKMSVSKMRYRQEKYVRDVLRIFDEELGLRNKALNNVD